MKSQAARHSPNSKSAEKSQFALRVSSGFNQGALVPLGARKKNILGRSFRACLPLEDDRVSREHAQINFVNGKFFLSDMGSTNGTYLNNEEVSEEVEIRNGDVIRIGNSIFRFEAMRSKDPTFHQKWKSETSVIPRAHFSFAELSKVKPDRYLKFKRQMRTVTKLLDHLQFLAIREMQIIFVRGELALTKFLFKSQKALGRFNILK